ncbi:MAG: GNAT family N-acetyltransferase [Nocardioidaceae bacterium]
MAIRPIDVHDDAELHRFHEICWRAEMEDGRPWNSFQSIEEMTAFLRNPSPGRRATPIGIFDGEEMVGGGMVQASLEDNLEKAFVHACVEPDRRGHGIGGELLAGLVEHARELGRTELMSGASYRFEERENAPVLRFVARHGFSPAHLEVVRECPLPVADALLDKIDAEVAEHAEGFVVQTFVDEVPTELEESYCWLIGQLALDAPTGDLDFEAEAFTPEALHHDMARDKMTGRTVVRSIATLDGQAVAHSDLMVRANGDLRAHQWGTLVHREHRGHRLGAAVKSANLRWLQRERPEVTVVSTQNAEVNEQMIGINARLGFAPVALVPEFLRRV